MTLGIHQKWKQGDPIRQRLNSHATLESVNQLLESATVRVTKECVRSTSSFVDDMIPFYFLFFGLKQSSFYLAHDPVGQLGKFSGLGQPN